MTYSSDIDDSDFVIHPKKYSDVAMPYSPQGFDLPHRFGEASEWDMMDIRSIINPSTKFAIYLAAGTEPYSLGQVTIGDTKSRKLSLEITRVSAGYILVNVVENFTFLFGFHLNSYALILSPRCSI